MNGLNIFDILKGAKMEERTKLQVVYTTYASIDINKKVFEQVDEEWKKTFYNLESKEEIIEHVTTNLLRGFKLSQMEGFADLPDSYAKLMDVDYEKEMIDEIE